MKSPCPECKGDGVTQAYQACMGGEVVDVPCTRGCKISRAFLRKRTAQTKSFQDAMMAEIAHEAQEFVARRIRDHNRNCYLNCRDNPRGELKSDGAVFKKTNVTSVVIHIERKGKS